MINSINYLTMSPLKYNLKLDIINSTFKQNNDHFETVKLRQSIPVTKFQAIKNENFGQKNSIYIKVSDWFDTNSHVQK